MDLLDGCGQPTGCHLNFSILLNRNRNLCWLADKLSETEAVKWVPNVKCFRNGNHKWQVFWDKQINTKFCTHHHQKMVLQIFWNKNGGIFLTHRRQSWGEGIEKRVKNACQPHSCLFCGGIYFQHVLLLKMACMHWRWFRDDRYGASMAVLTEQLTDWQAVDSK